MQQKGTGLNSNSGQLVVPDLFSLNNGVNNPTVEQIYNEKRINSLYGMFQVNWDGYLVRRCHAKKRLDFYFTS